MKTLRFTEPSQDQFNMVKREILKAIKFFYESIMVSDDEISNSLDLVFDAIKKGTLSFKNGYITGKLNSKMTKELREVGAKWKNGKFFLDSNAKGFKKLEKAMLAGLKYDAKMTGFLLSAMDKFSEVEALKKINIDKIANKLVRDMGNLSADGAGKDLMVRLQLSDEQEKRFSESYKEKTVAHIKGLMDSELKDIRKKVRENFEKGIRYDSLAREIAKKYKLSPERAFFIAKQETKILSTEIKRVRYTQAGLNLYKWITVNDGRVRSGHKVLHGTIQDWNIPPIVNDNGERLHPGEDVNCRCRALPVLK